MEKGGGNGECTCSHHFQVGIRKRDPGSLNCWGICSFMWEMYWLLRIRNEALSASCSGPDWLLFPRSWGSVEGSQSLRVFPKAEI